MTQLNQLIKPLRFGSVVEVDLTGKADWNRKRFVPAARVLIQDKGEVEITCRVSARHGFADEGIWWPPRVGEIVAVDFQAGLESGVIVGSLWSDSQRQTPTEATGDNVVIKRAGHVIIIDGRDGNGGITVKTQSGIEIDLQDKLNDQKLSVKHPSGTELEIDNAGNISLDCVGNLDAVIDGNADISIGGDLTVEVDGNVDVDVGGNIDVNAEGTAFVYAKAGVTIKADTTITLQTLQALSGIVTGLTHPVCLITGAPIGQSLTVTGSA